MTKAIVLTYAPVPEYEQKILRNTKIFKIALNNHAEVFKPDIRICSDYILAMICRNFPQKIISVRDAFRFKSNRVIKSDIEFKGATILCAVDWLIQEGYTDILIIGDNKVNTKQLQELIKTEIDKVKDKANIYQYTAGNFNLPVKSITEFISNVTN